MDGFTDAKFLNNNSKRWDGKASEVPTKTVVRTGRITDGFEEAEVHWPAKGTGKGKGGKVWKCIILPESEDTPPSPKKQRLSDAGEWSCGMHVHRICAIVLTAFST